MALIIDHQAITVPVGTRQFTATVPNGPTSVILRLARQTTATPTFWAAGVTVSLQSDCSLDGGTTWIPWLGFTAPGGILMTTSGPPPTGTPIESPESWVRSALPVGTNRRIRLTATVSGGQLVSQLTVEVL